MRRCNWSCVVLFFLSLCSAFASSPSSVRRGLRASCVSAASRPSIRPHKLWWAELSYPVLHLPGEAAPGPLFSKGVFSDGRLLRCFPEDQDHLDSKGGPALAIRSSERPVYLSGCVSQASGIPACPSDATQSQAAGRRCTDYSKDAS